MEGRLNLLRKVRQGVGPLKNKRVYGEMSHRVQSEAVAVKVILVT